MTRLLTNFDHVINALGGLKVVAELTASTPSAICRWRSRTGRFPARTYEQIQVELALRNLFAPRALWDFDPPRTYEDDEPKRAGKRA